MTLIIANSMELWTWNAKENKGVKWKGRNNSKLVCMSVWLLILFRLALSFCHTHWLHKVPIAHRMSKQIHTDPTKQTKSARFQKYRNASRHCWYTIMQSVPRSTFTQHFIRSIQRRAKYNRHSHKFCSSCSRAALCYLYGCLAVCHSFLQYTRLLVDRCFVRQSFVTLICLMTMDCETYISSGRFA